MEDAKAEAVEPVAESSVERSTEATPQWAEDSSNEYSQREDAQTTPKGAGVLEEQEPPSVDTEGSQVRETCPCVYVTSNLIGMSLSGTSGSEQRRRRRRQNSVLIDEDYDLSGHSKTSLLGTHRVDRASLESVLPSSISPFRTPSRSPNRRRRRPGISPLHGAAATSDGDTDLETSGKDDPSGKVDNGGTKDERGREVEGGEGGELDNSTTPSTFLAKHHSNHFLCLNLTGSPADRVTASSFNNQIINCPWTAFDLANRESEPASSSGDDTATASSSADKRDRHRSPSTPSLSAMLDICYVIAAYQSLGSQNVACVYCDNGRTRTGVTVRLHSFIFYSAFVLYCTAICLQVLGFLFRFRISSHVVPHFFVSPFQRVQIACYLKYEGRVRTSLDGSAM